MIDTPFCFLYIKMDEQHERGINMPRPKNVPIIREVKINVTSKEKYERIIEIIKMIIIDSVNRKIEEKRKQKNFSDGDSEENKLS